MTGLRDILNLLRVVLLPVNITAVGVIKYGNKQARNFRAHKWDTYVMRICMDSFCVNGIFLKILVFCSG